MSEPKKNQSSPDPKKTCRVCGSPLTSSVATGSPFCSERCRLQDLSKWFGENYRIASTPADTVPSEGDGDDE